MKTVMEAQTQPISLSRERLERRGDASGLVEEVIDFAARTGRRIAELERRIVELESLCETDELSELANRRGLHTFLERSLSRRARQGGTGLLLWFDLDGFKPINDAFGHAAGDALLRAVAGRLRDELRPSDCAARVGGDEFVVVCDVVDAQAAAPIRERFRDAVTSARVAVASGSSVSVDVSIGAVLFHGDEDADAVLAAADAAMYAEKVSKQRAADAA